MDRGYNDYALFMWLTRRGTKFVTRIKENAKTTRLKDDVIEETQTYGDYGFRFTQEQAQKFVETLVSGWCNGTTRIMTVGLNF